MEVLCPNCRAVLTLEESATCSSCGEWILLSAPTLPAGAQPSVEPTVTRHAASCHLPALQPGDRLLDRYRVVGLLGRGGFGEVLLTYDEKLKRDVALKALRAEATNSAAEFDRLLQEARTAAALRHPGIVAVYDVVGDDNGASFIVMEYVAGPTLADVLKNGPVAVDQAVRWIESVAQAMHEAHKLGFVHRDLKPANILIDENGRTHVTDFGLALHEDRLHLHRGEVAGTLRYMAPEQVAGRAHHLDARCDIWSLGCIFYEMLTGTRAFSGDNRQVAEAILHRRPKPPRQFNETIPPHLEQCCLKCLAKPADERFSTMLDVVEAMHGPPVDARVDGPRWFRWAALFAAACLCAAVFLPQVWRSDPEDAQRAALKTHLDVSENRIEDLKPGRWHDLPLPGHPPKALAFTSDAKAGHWLFSAEKREIAVDARTTSVITLGAAETGDFTIQLTIAKSAFTGISGLALGCQPARLSNGEEGFRYHAIVINLMDPQRYFVERELCELWFDARGVPAVSAVAKRHALVARKRTGEMELQVSVRRGRVTAVRWQGEAITGLEDSEFPATQPLPACVGPFGVVNNNGAVRFSNCRIMTQRAADDQTEIPRQ